MLRLKTILQYRYTTLLFLILVLIIAVIRNNIPIKVNINIETNNITGIIISLKSEQDKISFIVKGKDKIRCTYYLKENEKIELKLGSKITLQGKLSIPNNNTIPNTFNYKKYLENNDIAYIMNVEKIEVLNNKTSFLYTIKNKLIDYLKRYKTNNYLQMFIIGNKDYIDEEVYGKYQELGVSHIFAISGMHVSILTGIIFKLLYKIKDNHKYYIIISILLIYAFITSFQASVLRSIALYICLFFNRRFNLNLSNINVYYLAIAILILINPKIIFNVGFIYSSIISFSLIKYSYLIKGNYITKSLIISTISFLVSLPITINMNYEINILSILNNLVFVPLTSFIIYPLCLLVLLFPFLENVLIIFINILEYVSEYLFVYNVIFQKINIVYLIIYYLFINIYFISFQKKYVILLFILLISLKLLPMLDNVYKISYLDVNQGDSIILKYRNKVSLIDTGGKASSIKSNYYYTDNTIKYLKNMGINKVENLIISHGDYDHMGEAINLVNNFKVEKVIFNCGELNELEQDLIKVLDKKKIPYYSCITKLNIDKNKLYFLNNKDYGNENDNSSVIYTKLNNHKFLFMGDAGVEVEEDLIEKYNLQDIDVLKVGHHGSKTSSGVKFINKINPKYSVISVGKNNRYGHPNKEVLDNFNESKIFRTDINGSVMFKIKNNKMIIETYIPQK